MEAASNNELDYYISKLGLTTEREKRDFSCLFNYVLKPSLPHEENVEQFKLLTSPSSCMYSSPEIRSFQTVLKKYFQQSVYIDLAAVLPEAEAVFQKCMERTLVHYGWATGRPLLYGKIDIERHRSVITTLKQWIREVNELRRDSFQKRARREGELNFKIQLSSHFPLDPVLPREDQEFARFSDELKAATVNDFLARFPCFEVKEGQLGSWAAELEKACSAVIQQTLERSKNKMKLLELVISSEELTYYKETMATFLEKHPLAGEQRLRLCHHKARARAGENLSKRLCKSIYFDLESAWNAEICKEFYIFEAKWKAERERKIAAFLNAVRADAGQSYGEIFKSNTEEPVDELDQLLSRQVSEALARDLDKVDGGGFCECMDGEWDLVTMRNCPGSSKRSKSSAGGPSKRTKL